jgi:hypothetical protein
MRLPGEVGEGTADTLTPVDTFPITDITAITCTTGTATKETDTKETATKGTGSKRTAGTADMPAATRRRSLTGSGANPQGLAADSQAIIRASGCAPRREQTADVAFFAPGLRLRRSEGARVAARICAGRSAYPSGQQPI